MKSTFDWSGEEDLCCAGADDVSAEPAGSSQTAWNALVESRLSIFQALPIFVAQIAYLLAAAFSVTDEQFLKNEPLNLILGVELPVTTFFALAYVLVVLSHSAIMVYHMFIRDLATRRNSINDLDRQDFEWTRQHAPWLVRVLLSRGWAAFLALSPLVPLSLIQWKFLAYHGGVSMFMRAMAVVDCVFAMLFLSKLYGWSLEGKMTRGSLLGMLGVSVSRERFSWKLGRNTLFLWGCTLVIVLSLWLSFFVLRVPEDLEELPWFLKREWVTLTVNHAVIGDSESTPIDLSRRDLRGADFSNSTFANAILWKADFSGARLDGCSFRAAKSALYSKESSGEHSRSGWSAGDRGVTHSVTFAGASLRGSQFVGSKLVGADFFGADLRDADFDDSDLRYSDFREARADKASFSGADLSFSVLDGVSIDEGLLKRTVLFGASLRGASAWNVQGDEVDFRRADLSGASFADSTLRWSKFDNASTLGADFRSAKLRGSTNVALRGVDARWADFTSVNFSNAGVERAVMMVDLRGAMTQRPSNCVGDGGVVRQSGDAISRGLLYYGDGPCDSWPPNPTSETVFHFKLARFLAAASCDDYRVAGAIARRVGGTQAPRDPVLERAIAQGLLERLALSGSDSAACSGLSRVASENPGLLFRVWLTAGGGR